MPTVLIVPPTLHSEPSAPHMRILLEAGFEIRYPKNLRLGRGGCDEEETIEELRAAEAVIAGGEFYTGQVLEALPTLRVIARAGVGFDHVDISASTRRRIAVTITPTANHEAVAEHTLALLFAVAKSIVERDGDVRAGRWSPWLTRPVRGATLGIVGLGRVGRSVAVRAVALGMKVLAADEQPDTAFARDHEVELVSLEELLAHSDYVSIHCPLNKSTRGMFHAETFARMKPGSTLINTARGRIVVERDLVEALRSGHLSAAGLDVYEEEPPAADNPLFQLENVVLSPHLSGTDVLSSRNMGVESAQCIADLYQGKWPEGAVVNEELREGWEW